jgi:hypothetical protein
MTKETKTMKSKPILVAAFLAITRPAAHEPGHVAVQNLELVMRGISAKSAIEVVASCRSGKCHSRYIAEAT